MYKTHVGMGYNNVDAVALHLVGDGDIDRQSLFLLWTTSTPLSPVEFVL